METSTFNAPSAICTAFRPSYQGWKQQEKERLLARLALLDLPIRDGNMPLENFTGQKVFTFRPSYQGWKLLSRAAVFKLAQHF